MAKRSPKGGAGGQSGRMPALCTSACREHWLLVPGGPGQDGVTGRAPRRRGGICSRGTVGSELQVQSRSVNRGKEEHLENTWITKLWDGLD